ncbi:hypothetical protein PPTG_17167 [Phytophthora nicotianae INRA-310]|uniref:SET domain-containing protein n=1 Tax=Phytophthora nicotianae (strain INRA-310) TaxID=761204 RepID=W2PK41_PHYN3|nr:hypothetical protein PPTG_17167 [Phytophthora nicotianae INRA-310]ETN01368.1 hypothetical protein PPTG_17167 [Phytophthora nicotianae INRA-310]
MPGLSAAELPPETLQPGETLEYYNLAFVSGDPRGHRVALVTRVDATQGVEYPPTLDTGDVIPRHIMTKRVADRFGKPFAPEATKWRKIRTYQLTNGSVDAPSRSSAFRKALEAAVDASIEAVNEALRAVREDIVPESPLSDESTQDPEVKPTEPSSTPVFDLTSQPSQEMNNTATEESITSEETHQTTFIKEIINLVSSQEETTQPDSPTTGATASDAQPEQDAAYIRAIPTRYERAKIRHQPKKRNGQWHVPRSRKRRDLAKCAITRSGSAIYHAKAVKPVKFKLLLSSPEVKRRLENLHARRSTYPDPTAKDTREFAKEVPWPAGINAITTCKRNGVRFADIGKFDPCQCVGDCFWDVCKNVASATFCTPKGCNLSAKCSNAPRTLSILKLFDTGRVGLGVYTTTDLDIGDVVGEYCGELSELPAIIKGQPDQAVKQNSGYTLLYNAKSAKKNYVYVDALKCGSITRFTSHACDPNAAFVEQQTRTRVKVLVKMLKDVKAGAQITVHYGNERWFRCACDDCWSDDDGECEQEDDA